MSGVFSTKYVKMSGVFLTEYVKKEEKDPFYKRIFLKKLELFYCLLTSKESSQRSASKTF